MLKFLGAYTMLSYALTGTNRKKKILALNKLTMFFHIVLSSFLNEVGYMLFYLEPTYFQAVV